MVRTYTPMSGRFFKTMKIFARMEQGAGELGLLGSAG